MTALDELGMEPASVGVYTRNTLAVKSGLLDVNRAVPQAIIVIGAYEPVAELILWARHLGITAVFMNISFVGSNALAEALGSEGKGSVRHSGCAVPDTDGRLSPCSPILRGSLESP